MMDSFPRGRRPRDSEGAAPADKSTPKRKRDTSATVAASSVDKDYLFGDTKKSTTSKKKKKKSEDALTTTGSSFALPLGGGHVAHAKTGSRADNATIEALSFNKLAKGTKLLGIVREVHDDFCLVALPNLLTGYVLPPTKVRY
jgi:hypothetical protein